MRGAEVTSASEVGHDVVLVARVHRGKKSEKPAPEMIDGLLEMIGTATIWSLSLIVQPTLVTQGTAKAWLYGE